MHNCPVEALLFLQFGSVIAGSRTEQNTIDRLSYQMTIIVYHVSNYYIDFWNIEILMKYVSLYIKVHYHGIIGVNFCICFKNALLTVTLLNDNGFIPQVTILYLGWLHTRKCLLMHSALPHALIDILGCVIIPDRVWLPVG